MIKFKFAKETKNKVVYSEVETPEKTGSVYVQKWFLKEKFGKYPKHILIEIREE